MKRVQIISVTGPAVIQPFKAKLERSGWRKAGEKECAKIGSTTLPQNISGTQHKKREKVNKNTVQECVSFTLFMSEHDDNSKKMILRIMVKK